MLLMGTWYVATLLAQQTERRRRHVRVGHRPGAAVRQVHHRHLDHAGDLRRPDRPRHQPEDRQVQDRRGQGVPRSTRPARRARKALAGIGITPAQVTDAVAATLFAAGRRAARTTCRSSPTPRTPSSRRTRCRSTPPACRTSSTRRTRRSCPAASASTREQARRRTRAKNEVLNQSTSDWPGPARPEPHAGTRPPMAERFRRLPMATSPPARRPAANRRLVSRNTVAGWTFILPNFLGFARAHPRTRRRAVLRGLHELERLRRGRVGRHRQLPADVGDASFWTALRNTVYYTVVHIPLTLVGVARAGAAAQPEAARRRVLPHRRVLPLHHLDRGDRRGLEHAVQPGVRPDQRSSSVPSASTTRRAGPRRPTGRCRRSSSSAPGATWATT